MRSGTDAASSRGDRSGEHQLVRRGASRDDKQLISEAVTGTQVGELTTFEADRFELIRSELRPSGAEYTTLKTFILEGGNG